MMILISTNKQLLLQIHMESIQSMILI